MFSEAAVMYRAGILFDTGRAKYAFSRQYFMRHFVEFMAEKAELAKVAVVVAGDVAPVGFEAYFNASQGILTSDDPAAGAAAASSQHFVINGRRLRCPNYGNAYVYDDELVASEPDQFNADISYLAMAKSLQRYMNANRLYDAEVAKHVIEIMLDGTQCDTAPVAPIMIAALFLAEARRNPSVFLPSLMLLELIRYREQNPFGTNYLWQNCLQSPVLVNQNDGEISVYRDLIYPHLTGMPTLFSVQNKEKIKLGEGQKDFINANKKYNQRSNQKSVDAHEIHVQHGGYFPHTHRFSYAELKAKRSEGKEATSDIKSFILITDWLKMGDLAECIHANKLHCESSSTSLDKEKRLLTDYVFPFIWHSFMSLDISHRFRIQEPDARSPSMSR